MIKEASSSDSEDHPRKAFDYQNMYAEYLADGNWKEVDLQYHGSLLRYVFCEILAKRSRNIMEVSLPAFIVECRSLLEMFSDFVRPGLLVEIALGSTAEERMLRTLKFYLAGFSKMRGLNNLAKKPLNSVKGECFRCKWKPSASKQEAKIAPSNLEGTAEPYMQVLNSSNHPRPRHVDLNAKKSHKLYTGQGLMATTRNEVRFISEQVSHHPAISAFYADCLDATVTLEGTVETSADIIYGNFCHLFDKVRIKSEGPITIVLKDYREEYLTSLPTCYAKSVTKCPKLDFVDTVSLDCPKTGFKCLIDFPKPKTKEDRFWINAYVYSRSHGGVPLYEIKGCWNQHLTIAEIGGEPQDFFVVKDFRTEPKICYPVGVQEKYESRQLWKRVAKRIVQERWREAQTEKKKIESKYRKNPLKLKFFKQSSHKQ